MDRIRDIGNLALLLSLVKAIREFHLLGPKSSRRADPFKIVLPRADALKGTARPSVCDLYERERLGTRDLLHEESCFSF
jgi:hypothetical protein